MPIAGNGWELHVERLGLHKSGSFVRTYGRYRVFLNGIALDGLDGFMCETTGPGSNAQAGNGKRVEAKTYPLWTPVNVNGVSDAVAIEAGFSHACATRSSGQVVCWGANANGQLGDGTTNASATPVEVSGLGNATAISAGGSHSCAVRNSGQAVCWGFNGNGRLGDGTLDNRLVPTDVSGLGNATEIDVGVFHSCAIRSSGQSVCWGYNGYARRRERDRPDSVIQGFQVSVYKVDPRVCVFACNLLSKDDCRLKLADEVLEGWPQVPLVIKPSSFACRAERLARTGTSPNRSVVAPSGRPEGMGPNANACEEMALCESA